MKPSEAKASIAKLRPEVASGKTALLSKFKARIGAVENLRLVGVLVGVLGAFVAAISRSVQGNLGLGLAVGGAVTALVCGGIVGLMDRRKLEISQEASDAHEKADEAIEIANSLIEQLEAAQPAFEAFDRKRRERLTAIQLMIEVMEASLLTKSDVVLTAETLLSRAIQSIRAAVEYKGGDFFTVTIFQKTSDGGPEEMRRIAAQWTDPGLAKKGGRSWKIGKGYTGVAWQKACTNAAGDVVIGDTSDDAVRSQHPVDHPDESRESLYRSVAAIPILINSGNEVWGVVTATTDRPNVFVRDKENIKIQNVEMIRDIARVAALLAGLCMPPASEEAVAKPRKK